MAPRYKTCEEGELDHRSAEQQRYSVQQEDERGPVSGTYASLRPQPEGEVVMLSSTLSEDEDLDMDATDYSQYASTGADTLPTKFAQTLCMLPPPASCCTRFTTSVLLRCPPGGLLCGYGHDTGAPLGT